MKQAYLEQVDPGFEHSEKASQELFGYELPQILLIHCNELNSVTLRESIAPHAQAGVHLVTLDEATRIRHTLARTPLPAREARRWTYGAKHGEENRGLIASHAAMDHRSAASGEVICTATSHRYVWPAGANLRRIRFAGADSSDRPSRRGCALATLAVHAFMSNSPNSGVGDGAVAGVVIGKLRVPPDAGIDAGGRSRRVWSAPDSLAARSR